MSEVPSPWRCDLRVRAHDLDSTGMLSPVALIRMLETMRWHVFAGDLAGIFGRAVVRAQALEMLGAAGFDSPLTFSMWIARIGRTSLTLGHEIGVAGEAPMPLARAAATIVATDQGGRPTAVGEVAHRFLRPEQTLEIKRGMGEPPADAYTHAFQVQHHDLDLLQHVNQARYVDFVDSARRAAAVAGALGPDFDGTRRLTRIDVAYDDEARVGTRLSALGWAIDADTVGVRILSVEDGRGITAAQLELAPGREA